jgi:threonine synthase
VCLGALESLLASGAVRADERIVVFNTGAAQKYPEAVEEVLPLIDIRQPIDWERI